LGTPYSPGPGSCPLLLGSLTLRSVTVCNRLSFLFALRDQIGSGGCIEVVLSSVCAKVNAAAEALILFVSQLNNPYAYANGENAAQCQL
jgi:hypothetical protein